MAVRKWDEWPVSENTVAVDWGIVEKCFPRTIAAQDLCGDKKLAAIEADYEAWLIEQEMQGTPRTRMAAPKIHHRMTFPPKARIRDLTWTSGLIDVLHNVDDARDHLLSNIQSFITNGPYTTVWSNWSILFSSIPDTVLAQFNVFRSAMNENAGEGLSEEEFLWCLKADLLDAIRFFRSDDGIALLNNKRQVIHAFFHDPVCLIEFFEATQYNWKIKSLHKRAKQWKPAREFVLGVALWLKESRRPHCLYDSKWDYTNRVCKSFKEACFDWFASNKIRPLKPKTPVDWLAYVDLLARTSSNLMYRVDNRLVDHYIDPFIQVVLSSSTPTEKFALYLKEHSPINTLLVMSTETV